MIDTSYREKVNQKKCQLKLERKSFTACLFESHALEEPIKSSVLTRYLLSSPVMPGRLVFRFQ